MGRYAIPERNYKNMHPSLIGGRIPGRGFTPMQSKTGTEQGDTTRTVLPACGARCGPTRRFGDDVGVPHPGVT